MGISFDKLVKLTSNYKKVIVTGPQRSGTTYCSYLLSNLLEYEWIDETQFNHSHFPTFLEIIKRNDIVVQAPAISHLLSDLVEKSCIAVFMYRPNEEICASEDRIGWHPQEFKIESLQYRRRFREHADKIFSYERNAPMKKWIWENVQKSNMKIDFVEFQYAELENQPSWIPSDKRKNFSYKQIRL